MDVPSLIRTMYSLENAPFWTERTTTVLAWDKSSDVCLSVYQNWTERNRPHQQVKPLPLSDSPMRK